VDNPPSPVGDDNAFEIDWEATHKMVEKEEFEYQERLAQPLRWYKKLIKASRQALATVAALTRHSRCDQGHDAVNREIVLRLTS
jgi:hypothetical protein